MKSIDPIDKQYHYIIYIYLFRWFYVYLVSYMRLYIYINYRGMFSFSPYVPFLFTTFVVWVVHGHCSIYTHCKHYKISTKTLLNALLIIKTIHDVVIKFSGWTVNAHINSLFIRVNEYILEDKNQENKNIFCNHNSINAITRIIIK